MKIRQMLTPRNSKARCGYSLAPKYITIHNTANVRPTATANAHAQYLQGAGSKNEVSYHYVVDEKETVQCIPDNEVAWHAGDSGIGVGNRQSLAIEICENEGANLYEANQRAAELTAVLMAKYNISLKNVVQHNRWSGKNCPNRIRKGEPYDWAAFLTNVQRAYDGLVDVGGGESDEDLAEFKTQLYKQAQRIKLLEAVLERVKIAVSEVKI